MRVPVLGGIPKSDDLSLPERHLGLHMPSDAEDPRPLIEHLADVIEQHVDLDELLRVAGDFPSMGGEGGGLSSADLDGMRMVGDGMLAGELPPLGMPPGARVARIGVARDKSFCFYYKENLTLLRGEEERACEEQQGMVQLQRSHHCLNSPLNCCFCSRDGLKLLQGQG